MHFTVEPAETADFTLAAERLCEGLGAPASGAYQRGKREFTVAERQ